MVYVEFNNSATYEEVISAGDTETYILEATVTSVDDGADQVTTELLEDSAVAANFGAGFDSDLLYTVADNGGNLEAIIYDVNGDTVANAGNACTNNADDIILTGVVLDCTTVAAADYVADYKLATDDDATAGDGDSDTLYFLDFNGDDLVDALELLDATGGAAAAEIDANDTVALADEDLGFLYNADGSLNTLAQDAVQPFNFVWSDNSADNHSLFTSDWTNGFLVDDLGSAMRKVLTYNS